MERAGRPLRGAAWALAAILTAVAAVGLFVLLVADVSLGTFHDVAVALLVAAVVGAVIAMRGIAEERRRAEQLEREIASKRPVDELQSELDDAQEKLRREREARVRADAARKVEREWNRELREQVVNAHRERGLLGDTDDLKALVLHIATTMLEAEKGMLLQRHGSDGEARLEVTCAEGFDSDPRDSQLAKRFAREVLKKDTTIREDGN